MKKFKSVTLHPNPKKNKPCDSVTFFHKAWVNKLIPEAILRASKDGKIIIHHGETTEDSCTGEKLAIKNTTAEELHKKNLCSGDGVKHHIALFDDLAAQMAVDRKRKAQLTIKDEKIIPRLQKVLKKQGIEKQVSLTCDGTRYCGEMEKQFKGSKLHLRIKDPKELVGNSLSGEVLSAIDKIVLDARGQNETKVKDFVKNAKAKDIPMDKLGVIPHQSTKEETDKILEQAISHIGTEVAEKYLSGYLD